MNWVQDTGGKVKPWRAPGWVACCSDKGWWRVWQQTGEAMRYTEELAGIEATP